MARKPTTPERLSLIEETLAPVLVELLMFKIVLDKLLDFDLHRADLLDVDPLRYLIEEELAEDLIAMAVGGDPGEQLRRLAVVRALDFLDRADPDDPDNEDIPLGPGAANDD